MGNLARRRVQVNDVDVFRPEDIEEILTDDLRNLV